MGVIFKEKESLLRVCITGDIDHHSACKLCEQIDIKISLSRPNTALLDFEAVTFMDSSGLALVAGRKLLCDKLNCKIYIVNISGYPEKILRMAGADKLIEFKENYNEQ